jgi:hypothetical protein
LREKLDVGTVRPPEIENLVLLILDELFHYAGKGERMILAVIRGGCLPPVTFFCPG